MTYFHIVAAGPFLPELNVIYFAPFDFIQERTAILEAECLKVNAEHSIQCGTRGVSRLENSSRVFCGSGHCVGK